VMGSSSGERMVRMNIAIEDPFYGTPLGYTVEKVISVGAVTAIADSPVGFKVIFPEEKPVRVLVVYKKAGKPDEMTPLLKKEALEIPTSPIISQTEWENPNIAFLKPVVEHARAVFEETGSVRLGMESIRQFMLDIGIRYGFAEYHSEATSPADELGDLLAVGPDGKAIHPLQDCDILSWSFYILARSAGFPVQLVEGSAQDGGYNAGGYTSDQHMYVVFKDEDETLQYFESTAGFSIANVDRENAPAVEVAPLAGEEIDPLNNEIAHEQNRKNMITILLGVVGLFAVLPASRAGTWSLRKFFEKRQETAAEAQQDKEKKLEDLLNTMPTQELRALWDIVFAFSVANGPYNAALKNASTRTVSIIPPTDNVQYRWFDFAGTQIPGSGVPTERNLERIIENALNNLETNSSRFSQRSRVTQENTIIEIGRYIRNRTHIRHIELRSKFMALFSKNFWKVSNREMDTQIAYTVEESLQHALRILKTKPHMQQSSIVVAIQLLLK
ncbi:hypothetical protein KA082_03490, partial [Candidatus Woesebacteria bacterium]|nr:hypothetical protein [Candidatus Woesebacteria bacterium]